jgi:hypothetical protein
MNTKFIIQVLTFAADSLSISKRCKMNCVVEPFTISVKNTIPPVKKTNCGEMFYVNISTNLSNSFLVV